MESELARGKNPAPAGFLPSGFGLFETYYFVTIADFGSKRNAGQFRESLNPANPNPK